MGDTSATPADQATTTAASPATAANPAAPAAPAAPEAGAAPAAPVANPAINEPARLPDDHPLVTALAAQKTKTADLQAKVDQIPATVAADLRSHLIAVHQIDEATASTLITGTTPKDVLAQVAAVTGLTGRPADAPLLGTSNNNPPSEEAAFAAALFGGGNDS